MALTFHEKTLENGLTVIAECNDEAHTAAVGFFVRGGARDEQRQSMGVSHFLEHMMFKGTARRTADDVNREFDELGANYNAFTTHELTAYYAQVLPEFLPRAVDLLCDMMRPALREEDFEVEKKVILEEIGMYEDRPQFRLQDTIIEKHFRDHALSHRVLGTKGTVGDLAVEQMRNYFERCYGPDNMTMAAAGRLDFDVLVRDTERLAGSWKPTGQRRLFEQPQLASSEQTVGDGKLSRHYIALMCPAPSAQDEGRYAASIVSDVLGDADGSRLYWSLIDPGLADEAEFSHFAHDRLGSYLAFVSCDPERAEQVEATLLETIEGYAGSIDDDEIERAKNKIATTATLAAENPGGRMRGLGGQWTYLGRYIPLDVELKRIMAVDSGEVRRLVRQMPFQPRTVVRLGPGG